MTCQAGIAGGSRPDEVERDCAGGESFALRVLGDDMSPEFDVGDIIIVEPDGLAGDGSFVLALCDGEWLLRQLRKDAGRGWLLQALNPDCAHRAVVPVADLASVRGVVVQKAVPGRRRLSRFYV